MIAISAGLVVAGGLASYQVGVRARRPPHFRRGGAFTLGAAAAPTGAAPVTTTTTTIAPAAAGSAGATGATTTTTAVALVRSTAATPHVTAPAPAAVPVSTAATKPVNATPALGTYTYQVTGTEGSTGFGSRSFPKTATLVTHHDDGLPANQIVFDLTYSSDHTERAIAAYDGSGVSFVYEAGQVRFGPMAQTNQGDYQPPIVQVPLPLGAGASRTGDTKVLDGSGNVERSEHWTASVVGQDSVVVAGTAVPTWVVRLERTSDPGSGQQVHRVRTYWYDPARGLWVKYTEQMHGEQHYGGVSFTYDDDLTATLSNFEPAR